MNNRLNSRFFLNLIAPGLALLLLQGCGGLPVGGSRAGGASPESAKLDATSARSYRQALKLMSAEQYGDAEKPLLQVQERYPDLVGAMVNLGIVYTRINRQEDAIAQLQNAIEHRAGYVPALNQLGIAYREAGLFQESRQVYEQALDLEPDNPRLHWNLGILYDLYLQQPDLALRHYRKYQQLSDVDEKRISSWVADLENRTRSMRVGARGME